jgi:hypothetical protein
LQLTQLTELTVPFWEGLEPALCALRQLSALCFPYIDSVGQRLPAGAPWLRRLERLAAPAVLVLSSLDALRFARRLERLGATYAEPRQLPPILAWAAEQPGLVQLAFGAKCEDEAAEMRQAPELAAARRARPQLQIEPCMAFDNQCCRQLRALDD